MKNTLKKVEEVLKGEKINKEDMENIKEEYSSYFDEDSGNTEKEGLEQIKDYLEDELSTFSKASLAGLEKALDDIVTPKNKSE
jgi:uncharacterized protein YacL (UPF0231 family)